MQRTISCSCGRCALPGSAGRSRLSGVITITRKPIGGAVRGYEPLVGITVEIEGADGSVEAVTNTDGVYEAYDLAPGKYRVAPKVPEGTKVSFSMAYGVPRKFGTAPVDTVTLGANAGVSIDFSVREANSIAGRLVGPDGKGLEGVPVTILPLQGEASFPSTVTTGAAGQFRVSDFPSGEYFVVANARGVPTGDAPFGAVYWPGTFQRGEAQVVKVSPGEAVENLTIRVPELQRRITLQGRVLFRDGGGAANAFLQLVREPHPEHLPVKTDRDGRFRVQLVAGRLERLRAEWLAYPGKELAQCTEYQQALRQRGYLQFVTDEYPVGGERDASDIVLTLPVAACKAPAPTGGQH